VKIFLKENYGGATYFYSTYFYQGKKVKKKFGGLEILIIFTVQYPIK